MKQSHLQVLPSLRAQEESMSPSAGSGLEKDNISIHLKWKNMRVGKWQFLGELFL